MTIFVKWHLCWFSDTRVPGTFFALLECWLPCLILRSAMKGLASSVCAGKIVLNETEETMEIIAWHETGLRGSVQCVGRGQNEKRETRSERTPPPKPRFQEAGRWETLGTRFSLTPLHPFSLHDCHADCTKLYLAILNISSSFAETRLTAFSLWKPESIQLLHIRQALPCFIMDLNCVSFRHGAYSKGV